eukprot:scaffold125798_cov72-Phaeocystis_antarctica.AAC.3
MLLLLRCSSSRSWLILATSPAKRSNVRSTAAAPTASNAINGNGPIVSAEATQAEVGQRGKCVYTHAAAVASGSQSEPSSGCSEPSTCAARVRIAWPTPQPSWIAKRAKLSPRSGPSAKSDGTASTSIVKGSTPTKTGWVALTPSADSWRGGPAAASASRTARGRKLRSGAEPTRTATASTATSWRVHAASPAGAAPPWLSSSHRPSACTRRNSAPARTAYEPPSSEIGPAAAVAAEEAAEEAAARCCWRMPPTSAWYSG